MTTTTLDYGLHTTQYFLEVMFLRQRTGGLRNCVFVRIAGPGETVKSEADPEVESVSTALHWLGEKIDGDKSVSRSSCSPMMALFGREPAIRSTPPLYIATR